MRFSSIAVVAILAVSTFVHADFSHYEEILARKPFGEPPPEPPPPQPPPKQVQPAPPPFTKDFRMCAITESPFGTRVGFVNIVSKPPKNYFLYVGESEDGIEVVEADYDREGALLRNGAEEHWLYMSGKPGDALSSSYKTATKLSSSSQEKISYRERLRKRHEAIRRRKMEPPKFTGKELEEHLKNYQMECIRKGIPPLPIPLTKEMDDQLVKEGVLPPLEE